MARHSHPSQKSLYSLQSPSLAQLVLEQPHAPEPGSQKLAEQPGAGSHETGVFVQRPPSQLSIVQALPSSQSAAVTQPGHPPDGHGSVPIQESPLHATHSPATHLAESKP